MTKKKDTSFIAKATRKTIAAVGIFAAGLGLAYLSPYYTAQAAQAITAVQSKMEAGVEPPKAYVLTEGHEDGPPPVRQKDDSIVLPDEVKVQSNEGFVKITAATEADQLSWLVIAPQNIKVKYLVLADKRSIVVSVPSVFPEKQNEIVVRVIVNGLVNGQLTEHTSTNLVITKVQGQGVGTLPSDRRPDPVEKSKPTHLHVTVVADLENLDPQHAQILNDRDFLPQLKTAGHYPKIYDVNENADFLKSRNLDAFVKNAGGPPVLIIQDAKGVVLYSKKLPESVRDVLEVINAFID